MSAFTRATYEVWGVSIHGRLLLEKETLLISAEFDILGNACAEEKRSKKMEL
jgi:hypothetical protein